MFLPRFSGNDNDNPKSWIFRAELYFTYLGFDEKDWIPLPSFYLDGEALSWFNWLFRNKLFFDWNHFKGTFTQRFQQQTNRDVLGSLVDSSQIHSDYVNSVPIVSQSIVVSPFHAPSHFLKSSAIASSYDTRSSQAGQVLDKLPVKYHYVESVSLIAKNNTDVEPIEDIETPQIGNINSLEVNLVNEPSSITEDQVFDKIPHTTMSSNIHDMKAIVHYFEHSVSTVAKVYNVSLCKETKVPLVMLHDTNISNNGEEENSHDNMALFEKFPPLNTSGFLVAFAYQGTVMSNASSLLAEIDCSFVVALWLYTIPYWHNSPEDYCGDKQNRTTLCLDFRLTKCNWVDTGQECILPGFLLSDICAYKNFGVLNFSLGGVTWLASIMRPQTGSLRALPQYISVVLDNFFLENEIFIPTSDIHSVEVLLNAEHGTPTGGCDKLNLSQFPFDPGAKCVTVSICLTATDLSICTSRINFTFMALTGYTVSVKAPQLQGCSGRCCLIAYSNSMTRVWDPRQSWCANSSILQSDSALVVALSPNFTHFYIVERGLSFYLTTWRRNILVFRLVWHAENKTRYVDMRTLETCLLNFNVLASVGMLLLWKDNSGLAPVVKYLCSFWSARTMLILAYFHRCKFEGLDSKIIFVPFQMFMTNFIAGPSIGIDDYFCALGAIKPLVSRSAFLVSTQLVFSVGLGERNCTTYSIQAVVGLTIEVGIFDIGADNDMPTRNSTDAKITVPLISIWMAGTCPLFIPWYTTLLPFHEETLSANLVFPITLRNCYMVNLHNAFVVMHSLRSWIKQRTMIFSHCSGLKNKMEHMWLQLSYRIVITLPFDGIDAKKYVPLYESDILLLFPLLCLNLEDKVLIEEGSIVVNTNSPETRKVVGPGAKPRRGPRIRQSNNRFAWDPD